MAIHWLYEVNEFACFLKGSRPITWTLVRGPFGMKVDTRSGRVTWESTIAAKVPYDVIVRVNNIIGSTTVTWSLDVKHSYNATISRIEPMGTFDTPTAVTVYGHVYNIDGKMNRLSYVEVRYVLLLVVVFDLSNVTFGYKLFN